MHEGLEPRDGLGVLLALVGDGEKRDVAVVLLHPLEHAPAMVPGMHENGMTFTMPETPRADVINGLAHGEDGLALEGVVHIGPRALERRLDGRFMEAPEVPVEPAHEPVLVPLQH